MELPSALTSPLSSNGHVLERVYSDRSLSLFDIERHEQIADESNLPRRGLTYGTSSSVKSASISVDVSTTAGMGDAELLLLGVFETERLLLAMLLTPLLVLFVLCGGQGLILVGLLSEDE